MCIRSRNIKGKLTNELTFFISTVPFLTQDFTAWWNQDVTVRSPEEDEEEEERARGNDTFTQPPRTH